MNKNMLYCFVYNIFLIINSFSYFVAAENEHLFIDTLTSDGAWCWFADPRSVYFKGEKEQTFFGWITKNGNIMIAAYNHQNGILEEKLIHTNLEVDDHDNPTIFIRKDRRLIIFYSKHTSGPMYRLISDNPEDINSWSTPLTFGEDVTYPTPFQVGDSIYVFYRGINWHPTLVISSDNGETWGTPQQFIKGGGDRPYAKYTCDKQGGIHVAFTDGHPRDETNNRIFYAYYKNGIFRKANGNIIKTFKESEDALDIDLSEAEIVYDATNGKGWIWNIATDNQNFPVMVFASFPTDNNHIYYFTRWNGSSWPLTKITSAGPWFPQTPEGTNEGEPNYSGGISLDPNQPSIIYLSKPVNEIFEIWQWNTQDEGASWDSIQITKNSSVGTLNIRPYVPVNHKPGYFDVIWMQGTYIHYTNYNTSIMYQSPKEIYKKFDLGPVNSPSDNNSIPISEKSLFLSEYGFIDTSILYSAEKDSGNILNRDFVFSNQPAIFRIRLFDGKYLIKIHMGDASASHDSMEIAIQKKTVMNNINTEAGKWYNYSFETKIENNILDIRFSDQGGNDPFWIVNVIEIVTLDIFADSLFLEEDTVCLYENQSKIIHASVFPLITTDKKIFWFSENESVVSVKDGLVMAVSKGETYVKTYSSDSSLIDSCLIIVEKPVLFGEVTFDFGTSTSPLTSEAIRVTEQTLLGGSYGWLTTDGLISRDRSSSNDAQRDFIFSSTPHVFAVYIENGDYHIKVVQGDATYMHDNMAIYVNGDMKASGITCQIGEYNTTDIDLTVTEEKIEFEFTDLGGNDANWLVNYIEIKKKNSTFMQNISDKQIFVFPNPVTQHEFQVLTPEISEDYDITLIDHTGRIYFSEHIHNESIVKIALPSFINGIFHLKIQGNSFIDYKKILIIQ